MKQSYSVVVIGGGHAGCEAALAAARMGTDVLLVTLDEKKIAEMSCNPSIGGVGKGQLTKEIDALGGEMGKNADYTGIHFKRLNMRKGSAVQSSRCQSDKKKYAARMQSVVAEQERLTVARGEVKAILGEQEVTGVELLLESGQRVTVAARSVVVTAGTFMQGLMHCGDSRAAGGRHGERASHGLSDSLAQLGFRIRRLKTGTPPRLLRGSIDFSHFEEQRGDEPPRRFSFSRTAILLPQVSCFLTYTNEKTHSVIRGSLNRSPLFSGQIKGIGPRYCPSIEDKVVKFPEKGRHQLFFEPEALDSDWIYPNGISTSLPADVQEAFVRTIPGCEQIQFARHGYAVEYDCVDPTQLSAGLEAKHLPGLFVGGQVNGTSGYEEAAAQGLIAGINGALRAQGRSPFHLGRTEGYIGVMIDDLIHLGANEPYRMFTSRAEFRLSLREDNADLRLRPRGREIGLVTDEDYARYQGRVKEIEGARAFLKKALARPTEETKKKLENAGTSALAAPQNLESLLKRPELGWDDVAELVSPPIPSLSSESKETLEIEIKYEGYIAIQKEEIERLSRMRELDIPSALDFAGVAGLSTEVRQKLTSLRPKNLAEASRISGVTPAALTALLFHLKQKEPAGVRR